MAKEKKDKINYKNLKVNQEELSITKIGEISSVNQSPVFILVLFGLLLAFIFFLPTITNYIKGEDETTSYETPKETPKEEEPLAPEEEIKMYSLSDTLSISLEDKVTLNQFSLTDEALSFQVTNNNQTRFDFDAENYFLELYTEDNTLLDRILLEDVVNRETSLTIIVSLSSTTIENVEKISFVQKETSDYPNVVLEKNESDETILTCTNAIETLTYKFQNEKLYEVEESVSVNSANKDYLTLLNDWKVRSESLNALDGVTSVFVDTGVSFVANTTVDLKTAKIAKNENKYYYSNETLAKVINFEMESRGFSCK